MPTPEEIARQHTDVLLQQCGWLMNEFAMLWLNSFDAQKRIHTEKVDVARANFSLEDTRALSFPLPPLAEQTRIVAEVERRLSMMDQLESVVSANLQRATRLRQSILKKAFGGELTYP